MNAANDLAKVTSSIELKRYNLSKNPKNTIAISFISPNQVTSISEPLKISCLRKLESEIVETARPKGKYPKAKDLCLNTKKTVSSERL